MIKLSLFKRPGYLLFTVIFSIVAFYIINYLVLSEYFKLYIVPIYSFTFDSIINNFRGRMDILGFLIISLKNSDYPILYFLNLLLPIYFFGKNWTLLLLVVNTFYLLILLVFTYLIGKAIRDEKTGLIAVILISLYPLTWMTYRIFTLEFPVMAVIVMSVYILHKSGYFSDLKWSVFFAVSCAWGMWIKDVFGAFITGPILYGLYRAIAAYRKDKNIQPLLNFMVFSTTFYILICPYYFYNFKMKGEVYTRPFIEPTALHWHSFENIKPFLFSFWQQLLTLPFLIVFAASIYYFIKYCERNIKASLLLSILISTVMLILMPHWKNARYLIPLLPIFALISALFLRKIIEIKAGILVLLILIITSVTQYYTFTYGRTHFSVEFILSNIADYKKVSEELSIVTSNLLEEAGKIQMDDKNKDRIIVTAIGDFNLERNLNTVFWFNNIHDLDFNSVHACNKTHKQYLHLLNNSSILLKTANMDRYERIKKSFIDCSPAYKTFDWEQYESVYNDKISKFKLVKTFSIPSGKIFYLYTQ